MKTARQFMHYYLNISSNGNVGAVDSSKVEQMMEEYADQIRSLPIEQEQEEYTDDQKRLHEMYNATSTDDGHGEIETYEAWLERQLLRRMDEVQQLVKRGIHLERNLSLANSKLEIVPLRQRIKELEKRLSENIAAFDELAKMYSPEITRKISEQCAKANRNILESSPEQPEQKRLGWYPDPLEFNSEDEWFEACRKKREQQDKPQPEPEAQKEVLPQSKLVLNKEKGVWETESEPENPCKVLFREPEAPLQEEQSELLKYCNQILETKAFHEGLSEEWHAGFVTACRKMRDFITRKNS